MGMDVNLVRYLGRNENGTLNIESAEDEFDWDTTRYTIRKELLHLCTREIPSDMYGDWTAISRPDKFFQMELLCDDLKDFEFDYMKNILDILKKNKDLYLEFST